MVLTPNLNIVRFLTLAVKHFLPFPAFSAPAEFPSPMNGDSTIWRWQRSAAMLVCTDEHFYRQPLQAVKAADPPPTP